ncbi:MAG: flagellar biosynthesis protein FlgB [Acidobacteria bacterium]|nr:flagellar biosynthesis protein FlgB [Acidobacteriota bacterium]
MIESVTANALNSALNGLSLRQRTIANNVANINTPGYHAQRVMFEDALSQAVSNGTGAANPTIKSSLEPTQLNGNNVNLDEETLNSIETNLRYEFASNAMNNQFTAVRAALKES